MCVMSGHNSVRWGVAVVLAIACSAEWLGRGGAGAGDGGGGQRLGGVGGGS
jgi:hypothetical protein